MKLPESKCCMVGSARPGHSADCSKNMQSNMQALAGLQAEASIQLICSCMQDGGVLLCATTRENVSPFVVLELLRRIGGIIKVQTGSCSSYRSFCHPLLDLRWHRTATASCCMQFRWRLHGQTALHVTSDCVHMAHSRNFRVKHGIQLGVACLGLFSKPPRHALLHLL